MRIMDHKVLRKERSILVIMVEQLRLQWILMLTMIWISVFATYSSTTFSWYENNGSQNFTKNSINSNNVRDPVIIDLDEDGDLDFVSDLDDGSDKIVWYENDGFQSFTQNTIDNIDGGHLDVVDLDEDGDYD